MSSLQRLANMTQGFPLRFGSIYIYMPPPIRREKVPSFSPQHLNDEWHCNFQQYANVLYQWAMGMCLENSEGVNFNNHKHMQSINMIKKQELWL